MATTGQTINDRLNAVRYALAGQGLARTVCKATTEEVLGPKKKHIDYLLACTDEPNVSIPQLANLLIDRTQHTSWTVVFKSLITIHHLLDYGNERFTQYLATSNHSFELNDFMDRTTPQGYGMSTFVRSYAKYINDKIGSYKTLAIDLCKVKPGKDNALRTMNMDNLTKTLPVVHNQFDSLLDFGVEPKDLNNGIILAAFRLLYKDLNRIFAAYQEAIINLVERYFKLSRKKTREALNMYKKYLDRMDKVANFFKVVEQVGMDKSEMPDTSKLTSLLGLLEEHLSQLEAKKRGATPTSPDAPGGGGDDDEPVSPNKENRDPEPQQSPGESKRSCGAPKPAASHEPLAGSSKEGPKKAPPPARPSPIVSPKVSPLAPKQAPSVSAATASSSSSTTEKKAPPERPAKPPSRPPPPSSTMQAAPTGSTQSAAAAATTTTTTTATDQADKQHAPNTTSTNESGASPTPPTRPPTAHPQPPRPQSPAAATATTMASSPQTDEATEQQGPSAISAPQGNGSAAQVASADGRQEAADGVRPPDDSATDGGNTGAPRASIGTQPTCSGAASETTDQLSSTQEEQISAEVQEEQQASDTNHVNTNNVNNHNDAIPDGEIDPPTPPPPIEDDVGDNANELDQAEQNHQNNANHEEPLPPPPPPVEE